MSATKTADLRDVLNSLTGEKPESVVRQLAALARTAAEKCCLPLVDFFLEMVLEHVNKLGGARCGVNADVGWVLEQLAQRKLDAKELVDAEALMRQSITFYNDNHSDPTKAAAVMRKLAAILEQQPDRLAEAEDLCRQALEIDEMVGGVVECVSDLSELGDMLRSHERYAEAEEAYKQALELTFLAWGERDPRAFDLIDYYASCRLRQGFEQDWRDLASYRAALARGDHGALYAIRPTHLLPHFTCNDGVLLHEQLRKAQEKASGKGDIAAAPAAHRGHH